MVGGDSSSRAPLPRRERIRHNARMARRSGLHGNSARASRFARLAAGVYAALLVFASLTPWSGWRDLGHSPLAWIAAPTPAWITGFDLGANLLGYLPLGFLLVFALHPRVSGLAALLAATLAGALVSGLVESVQVYLPARVPSNLDWLSNVLGSLLGAALALPLAAPLIERGRLLELRARWLDPHAQGGLVLILLWPLAQLYPEPMLFGNGHAIEAISGLVGALGGSLAPYDPARFGPAEFVLAEAVVVTAAVLAAGLMAAALLRPQAPRLPLLAALILAALALRTLASGLQAGPERALVWLTPGALGGLVLGSFALAVAAFGPARWLPRAALIAIAVLLFAVNAVPPNPYFALELGAWRPGRATHLWAVAQWLSVAWPWAAAAWLALRSVAPAPRSL
jgi:VanZ family protein